MKVRMIFWALLLAVSLSKVIPAHHIAPELNPYVLEIKELTSSNCPSIKYPNQFIVKLDDLTGKSWIGVCRISAFRSEITIDKEYWTSANDDDRISVIAHESAHCILDIDHRNDPNDYMNPTYTKLRRIDVLNQYIKDVKENCDE